MQDHVVKLMILGCLKRIAGWSYGNRKMRLLRQNTARSDILKMVIKGGP
jgi:hypothetical protein